MNTNKQTDIDDLGILCHNKTTNYITESKNCEIPTFLEGHFILCGIAQSVFSVLAFFPLVPALLLHTTFSSRSLSESSQALWMRLFMAPTWKT